MKTRVMFKLNLFGISIMKLGFSKILEKFPPNKTNHLNAKYKEFIKEKLLLQDKDRPISIMAPYKLNHSELHVKFFNQILHLLPVGEKDFIVDAQKKAQTMELLSNITGIINFGVSSSNLLKNPAVFDKIITPKYQINVYYPIQFEALRACNNITLASFIKSISASMNWLENSGGKSNASFIKTYDNLYVFKQLDKSDFRLFSQFIFSYFEFMWNIYDTNRPSLLAKIYGLFEVQTETGKKYFIAMENLFFGIDSHTKTRVYDLKGSELNRYLKPNKLKQQTFLDTNLKIDQNGEPLPISNENIKWIFNALDNDTCFLASQQIVDYSMLLIINDDDNTLKMGIIDYAILYTWEKQVEHVGKKFIRGNTPTITNPNHYKERFINAMKKYFMGIYVE